MADYIDFYGNYVMGSVQMLFGFYLLVRFLRKKIRFYFYFIFEACALAVICFVPAGTIAEFGVYVLLLMAGGILICASDWKSAVLYAALVVEIMQISFGIVNSLLSIFYPLAVSFNREAAGIIFMFLGDIVSLLLTGFGCLIVYKYFSYYEDMEKQYMFLVLIPVLMIFIMERYINSFMYGMVDTNNTQTSLSAGHYQMLVMQLLEAAGLICILSAYKKMLWYFRLSTKLSLLEQEEHSLNQYVEEAKVHYEKTKSFRHDIKNHITVLKELLQNGRQEQALSYIGDMEKISEELSFPCGTNNLVVDILVGNKLGIAKSMGIDVDCHLLLPYPCGLRDIDICIILSNALDNAVAACKSMDFNDDRHICVSGRIQGDFLFIEIENSFQGNKIFKRGTGLSNIKAVAEKYNGTMSVKTQGKVFILNVLLIIPQHQESISRQTD